jgi:hypothetical protein
MEENIRVLYFKVGRPPEEGYMGNSVEGMQKAIGGFVQALPIYNDRWSFMIICDEEGFMKDLPFNRGLLGDWLIIGSEGEEFISLTKEQIDWMKEHFDYLANEIKCKFINEWS